MFVSSHDNHVRVKVRKSYFSKKPLSEQRFITRYTARSWSEGFYLVLIIDKNEWWRLRGFFPELDKGGDTPGVAS